MSAAQFTLDLEREWNAKEKEIGEFVQEVALAALRSVVQMSPVGNPDLWGDGYQTPPEDYIGGTFKGNWNVSVGAMDHSFQYKIDPDGGATIAKGAAVIEAYPPDAYPVIYVQNNLPYAMALEGGHSSQAPGPGAMVGITISNLSATYAQRQI